MATVRFSWERLEEWTNSANEPALHCREANEPACQGPTVELLSTRGPWLGLAALSRLHAHHQAVMVTGGAPVLAASWGLEGSAG